MAIEVRVGSQGVKAKWVRIELRKVETLPGGGSSNTFYDFVGPSPVNLWNSSDEYSLLRTQDFPFSIRIPESIPPSLALENRAGIQYELVASLCTKGKKSFFRRRKSTVVSTQAGIIIDKHELHSTWPVYCQPETRQVTQDGCTLTVDRNQTCYGPGDRIAVMALLRSDSLDSTVLRGFELTLKETTIFRAGAHSGKKSAAPQVRVVTISDNKLPINVPLRPGAENRAELTCSISPNHTTTSLNSARHIDVTYTLTVNAIVDNKSPIVLHLPVVVSNWQRIVSQEAVRRIGPAPTLSLIPVAPAQQTITRHEALPRISPTASTLPLSKDNYGHSANAYNSLPAKAGGYHGSQMSKVDELGGYGYSTRPTHHHSNSAASTNLPDDFGSRTTIPASMTAGRRPGSAISSNQNRLTVINALPSEIPQAEATNSASLSARGPWPSAEDEKQRLYEAARAKVERVQGNVARVTTPPPQPVSVARTSGTPPPKNGPWPTAEEEKLRLFNRAQAAVQKTQGIDYSPPPSRHGPNDSDGVRTVEPTSTSKIPSSTKMQSSPAELYSQAMNARNQALAKQQSANSLLQTTPPKASVPQYLTAEQEKAALRRYQEAKLAVDRVQNGNVTDEDQASPLSAGSAPIAYDSLYPDHKAGASSSTPTTAPANDLPPPFGEMPANLIPASHLSEKERLRRAYEEQDAAALARQHQRTPPNASPPPFSQRGPAPVPALAGTNGNHVLSEKEILRRKFEAQDALALNASPGRASPPKPPPRTTSGNVNGARGQRPTPTPPTSPGKILTAAEEKALLKAQYAAQDARAAKQQQQQRDNGAAGPSRPSSTAPHTTASTPPSPPPLMPRPPVEYIQETQEEDARVSSMALNGALPASETSDQSLPKSALEPRSFSSGFESVPPPPLPPKPLV
ncbi:hypothetical protein DXG03_006935 [Asterophora parasitica]|uniref:Arrestin C-terminal-like domain-containing protein n=1 Tax=Asterophora parasitica TaxID=117018 RepID=A0A9P7G110_9AGAR|nr:hypothetical protein DXG03_006935 [Asterophora parasitica]